MYVCMCVFYGVVGKVMLKILVDLVVFYEVEYIS